MSRLMLFAVASWFLLGSVVCADDKDEAKALRDELLKAKTSDDAAAGYKKLFLHVGLGLEAFTDDADTSLALQAAWELNKKVVKRPKPLANRTDWVFEEASMKKFLDAFAKRTGVEPPQWWRKTLLAGEVFPGMHHAFIELEENGLPPDPKIKVRKKLVTVSVDKKSIRVPKDVYEMAVEEAFLGSPVALLGAEQSVLAFPAPRAYPFDLLCLDSKSGKVLWKAEVWAARRGASSGLLGSHPVEILRKGDTCVVFGCESHGIYAEGFDAKTGKNVFRFCSCYWFNNSETWGLK